MLVRQTTHPTFFSFLWYDFPMFKFFYIMSIFLLPFLSMIVSYYLVLNDNSSDIKFIRPGFMLFVLLLLPAFCVFIFIPVNELVLSFSCMLMLSGILSICGFFFAIPDKFARGYHEIYADKLKIKEKIISHGVLHDGYLYLTDKSIINVYFDWSVLDLSYDVIPYNSVTDIKKRNFWNNILIYADDKKYEIAPKTGVDVDAVIEGIKEIIEDANNK